MPPQKKLTTENLPLAALLVAIVYAGVAALWIIGSSHILTDQLKDVDDLARAELIKGLGFVAITSVLLYGLLRAWISRLPLTSDDRTANVRAKPLLWVLSALLVLAVPASGLGILQFYGPEREQEVLTNLQSVARLRAEQIKHWHEELDRYAQALQRNGDLALAAENLDCNIAPQDCNLARAHLSAALLSRSLDGAVLLSPDGRALLSEGSSFPISLSTRSLVTEAMRSGLIAHSDFFIDDDGTLQMDVVIPIGPTENELVGTLILSAAAERFSVPLIEVWPRGSSTAETRLLRRDGPNVTFLTPGHLPGSARRGEPLPLDQEGLVPGRAARALDAGVIEGLDSRGVKVLAAYEPVGNTGWRVLAKIDQAEAMAPVRTLAIWVVVAATAMAGVLMLFWWQQRRVYRLALLAKGSEHDRLLRQFFDLPFIGMALTAPDDMRWVRFNDRLCEILGYSRDELAAMNWVQNTHPDDLANETASFRDLLSGEIDHYSTEKRFISKDGTTVHAKTDIQAERKADGTVSQFLVMLEDITERKHSEQEVLKLSRYYAARSRTNEAIIRAKTPAALLSEVCRIAIEYGQFALVWVGRTDTNGKDVTPFASSGAATGYLRQITVSTSADRTDGLGPLGCATREGTTQIIKDIATDPVMAPWQSTAHQFGLRSMAVCPLVLEDGVWGGIAYYANDPDYFNPDLVQLLEELASDIAFSLDAMESRRRRAEAEEQSLLNAKLIESSHEGIFILDDLQRFTMANDAFCAMTGYTQTELVGTQLLSLEADQSEIEIHAEMLHQLEAKGRWEGETLDRRKDGSLFPAWKIITAVHDPRLPAPFHVGFCIDITLRKEADSRMQHLANHDLLTDLPNRALFLDRLDMAIKAAKRQGGKLAVLFVDLDRFKLVNDTLGHDVGDLLLREVSARIGATVRAADTVSRLGGDEFVILLSEIASAEGAAKVAEKIIKALSAPFILAGHQLTQRASLGIAIYPDDAIETDLLLSRADAAMFTAKRSGRARYEFYSPELGTQTMGRLQIETGLRDALAKRELSLVYQPQYDLTNGRVVGYEVLARWFHPELGQVSPGLFIPIAEESGHIREIGTWVLNTACEQANDWRMRDIIDAPVAVNVSAVQFRQSDFVAVVASALKTSGLPAEMLELEVTESVIMEGIDQVLEKLDTLHSMGIKLAIDDFGTGYSSLSYLRRFPTQRLKMDQSFVRDLPDNPDAVSIARAIISLGRGLGMNVIAEGVENRAQADFLRSIWCTQAQGYLYSYPLTAAKFEACMLSDRQPPVEDITQQTQT